LNAFSVFWNKQGVSLSHSAILASSSSLIIIYTIIIRRAAVQIDLLNRCGACGCQSRYDENHKIHPFLYDYIDKPR
jgi:hypothetical protein